MKITTHTHNLNKDFNKNLNIYSMVVLLQDYFVTFNKYFFFLMVADCILK